MALNLKPQYPGICFMKPPIWRAINGRRWIGKLDGSKWKKLPLFSLPLRSLELLAGSCCRLPAQMLLLFFTFLFFFFLLCGLLRCWAGSYIQHGWRSVCQKKINDTEGNVRQRERSDKEGGSNWEKNKLNGSHASEKRQNWIGWSEKCRGTSDQEKKCLGMHGWLNVSVRL